MYLQEWGNPVANQSTYDLMLSYSPMDNVKQEPYPSMLAVGGIHSHQAHFPLSSPRALSAKFISGTSSASENLPG